MHDLALAWVRHFCQIITNISKRILRGQRKHTHTQIISYVNIM